VARTLGRGPGRKQPGATAWRARSFRHRKRSLQGKGW